jgi:hypothetical protein
MANVQSSIRFHVQPIFWLCPIVCVSDACVFGTDNMSLQNWSKRNFQRETLGDNNTSKARAERIPHEIIIADL